MVARNDLSCLFCHNQIRCPSLGLHIASLRDTLYCITHHPTKSTKKRNKCMSICPTKISSPSFKHLKWYLNIIRGQDCLLPLIILLMNIFPYFCNHIQSSQCCLLQNNNLLAQTSKSKIDNQLHVYQHNTMYFDVGQLPNFLFPRHNTLKQGGSLLTCLNPHIRIIHVDYCRCILSNWG